MGALWVVGIDLLAVINFGLLAHRFPPRRDLFQALAGCFAVLGVVAVLAFVRSNKEPISLALGVGNGMLLAVLVILAVWQGYHITRKGVRRRGGTPPRLGSCWLMDGTRQHPAAPRGGVKSAICVVGNHQSSDRITSERCKFRRRAQTGRPRSARLTRNHGISADGPRSTSMTCMGSERARPTMRRSQRR
jgi:hypothetical protein